MVLNLWNGPAGLPERLVIDASHANSAKDHERQPRPQPIQPVIRAAGGIAPGKIFIIELDAGQEARRPGIFRGRGRHVGLGRDLAGFLS